MSTYLISSQNLNVSLTQARVIAMGVRREKAHAKCGRVILTWSQYRVGVTLVHTPASDIPKDQIGTVTRHRGTPTPTIKATNDGLSSF